MVTRPGPVTLSTSAGGNVCARPATAVDVLEPAQARMQDAPHARAFAFFFQAHTDERAVEIGGGREAARFQRIEGAGVRKAQAVETVGRSLVIRKHVRLGQDEPEGDRAGFLAQETRLVANHDEFLQGVGGRGLFAPRIGRVAVPPRMHALPAFQDERGDGVGGRPVRASGGDRYSGGWPDAAILTQHVEWGKRLCSCFRRNSSLFRVQDPTPTHRLANPLPRWRGFNLLEMYAVGSAAAFVEEDFRWIAEWGFDFVRLPLSYTHWIKDGDPLNIDFEGEGLARLDRAVEMAGRHGLHVSLNLHRAPGYCVNTERAEPFNLWRDPAALQAFCAHWQTLARRYAGIGAGLSFDLLNEPPPLRPVLAGRVQPDEARARDARGGPCNPRSGPVASD